MATFDNDLDAVLVRNLFGPDAAAIRAGINEEVLERIDEAATAVLPLGGWQDVLSGQVGEGEAERLTREIAARARAILAEHQEWLRARQTASRVQQEMLEDDIEQLRLRIEEIQGQVSGEEAE